MEQRTEGIVLQSIPFRNRDRILKVFTKERGMISLILKKISPKNPERISLSSSFSVAEFLYEEGKKDLHVLKEGKILETHLSLREDYSCIEASWDIMKALLKTQPPEKPSYPIYALLKSYLKKIPLFSNPKVLVCSFFLKTLLQEGILHLDEDCSICKKRALSLFQGESYCPQHAPPSSYFFSEEEYPILFSLTYSRKFSDLQNLALEKETARKIYSLILKDFP